RIVAGGSSDKGRARPLVVAVPTAATRSTRSPSDAPNHNAPAAAPANRTSSARTAEARSARVPPDAMSWLSWYWANSASASRCDSSKDRRPSRSRASTRSSSSWRSSVTVRSLATHGAEQQQARDGTGVEVADRAVTQAHGEAPSRDEGTGRANGTRGGGDGRRVRRRWFA